MVNQLQYLEDYQIGQKGITPTRTVTEADIVNFACLTGDYSRVHMDRHYATDNIYGGRIAHGPLGASLVTGMLSLSAPHILGRGVPGAYFYRFDSNYRGAIKMGDTINVQWRVAEKVDDSTHEGFGLIKTAFQVVNQAETPVNDGTLTTLVRKKSAKDTELQLEPGDLWQVTEYVLDPEQICYAEDFPVGKGGETDGRTITETDIVNFAGLTGDYNPQYVDAEFAKGSMFGERIAHAMLVFTIAHGLWPRVWDRYRLPESKIAGHLNDSISFFAPVKIGDTIGYQHKILSTRVSKSKPEVGIITFGVQVINQRNEVVQEGSILNMIPSRAGLRMQSTA